MKRTDKTHINERMKTGLANTGRAAGVGVLYDHYDEDSYGPKYNETVRVRLPSDSLTPDEIKALSGDVKTYKLENAP